MGERNAILASVLTLAFLLSAAVAAEPARSGKLNVIATLFPQYDFARQIARENAEVTLLLPPGAESHSFEPTPEDMRNITSADIFIYTGEHMEPWAKRLADSADSKHLRIVDASLGIALKSGDSPDSHDDHEHNPEHDTRRDGHNHTVDPHIWLDPVMAQTMVKNIGAALVEKDPANASLYKANTLELQQELDQLDDDIRRRIAQLPKRLLIFGDRFAFNYFFARYGLESASPYTFCAAGAEPGLRAVIDTISLIKKEAIQYIYVEEMTTSRMADTIRQETGVTILHVEGLHNPPRDKQAAGIHYQSAMKENMDAFAKGLE